VPACPSGKDKLKNDTAFGRGEEKWNKESSCGEILNFDITLTECMGESLMLI
jgi:hypothetical protein